MKKQEVGGDVMSIRGNKERKEIDIVVADHREESENGV